MEQVRKHLKEKGLVYLFGLAVLFSTYFLVWVFFISDILKNFLLWVEVFFQTQKEYAYLVAFLAAIAEGTIILSIVPGTSYIVTTGVFWARGDVDPFILFPIVILGAFLGDILGYVIGHFSSRFVKERFGEDENYKTAKKFVDVHGGKSVFFARFISGVKELVPFVCGILFMNIRKFMFWNFLGAIGWSFLFIGLGYVLGDRIKEVESIVKAVGFGILSFFGISMFILYKRNKDTFLS